MHQNAYLLDLSGQTAIVTGGTRGIGRVVAGKLARSGASLVLGYHRDEAAADETRAEIEALGGKVALVAGDVSLADTAERLFESAEAFGPVDLVVGNAGLWERVPIDRMSEEEWRRTLETNLTSIFHLTRRAARAMKPRKQGRMVLISSTAGQRGEPYHSHYAASKGGLVALAKSLAGELGPHGIQVNCVAPGWVHTDMTAEVFSQEEFRKTVCQSIPLRRIATAEDVANAVLFLASEMASFLQGEVISVNGGSVMCG